MTEVLKNEERVNPCEQLMTRYYGRMNDCTSSAAIQGPCGDEMEVYLDIADERITDIKVYSTGCEYTDLCGVTMAALADQRTVFEALGISPKAVLEKLPGIPLDHKHCAILAVSALYRAIALFWLHHHDQ